MDLSRVSSGNFRVTLQRTNAAEVVERALEICNPFATEHCRNLESQLQNGLDPFLADPDRLVQALRNLIDNAIKYSPPDQPVRVTAVKDGKHIAFAVTDKGQGVAPELSKTIFEAFERLEPERLQLWQMQGPTARGVGIGLTLCRAITMAHEGSITLSAQPGQGSTFTVRLPIRDNLSTPREV